IRYRAVAAGRQSASPEGGGGAARDRSRTFSGSSKESFAFVCARWTGRTPSPAGGAGSGAAGTAAAEAGAGTAKWVLHPGQETRAPAGVPSGTFICIRQLGHLRSMKTRAFPLCCLRALPRLGPLPGRVVVQREDLLDALGPAAAGVEQD